MAKQVEKSKDLRKSTVSKIKLSNTSNPVIAAAPTEADLIADMVRVNAEHPEAMITRNFYRSHGKFSEGSWQAYYSRFSDFRAAAGLVPDPLDKPKGKQKDKEEVGDSGLLFTATYTYNEDTDFYIIIMPRLGTPLKLAGDLVRNMRRAYSDSDGDPQSINEICRSFKLKRSWFIEMKSQLGWTHDADPFTAEEIHDRAIDDMVEDVEMQKRYALDQALKRKEWEETQKDARKWRNFEVSVYEPLGKIIAESLPAYKPPVLKLAAPREKFALVVANYDLHYAKAGWSDETGDSYSRAEARKLLTYHTSQLVREATVSGRPDRIICASGGDYFHVDNLRNSTTADTLQDTDGQWTQIFNEGCDLAIDQINMLSEVAPVQFLVVPGNHDEQSSLSLMRVLKERFRNSKRVTIDNTLGPVQSWRKYTTYGNSLLGFWHGHGMKIGDMHACMSKEARTDWRLTDKHYAFSGHLHHEVVREIHGMKHFQVSSLAGKDRWTAKNGYITSDRAMQAYKVTQKRGITAEFISPVIDTSKLTGIKVRHVA